MFCSETIKGGFNSHWGARTGIASSDIDYIIYKKNKQYLVILKMHKNIGAENFQSFPPQLLTFSQFLEIFLKIVL